MSRADRLGCIQHKGEKTNRHQMPKQHPNPMAPGDNQSHDVYQHDNHLYHQTFLKSDFCPRRSIVSDSRISRYSRTDSTYKSIRKKIKLETKDFPFYGEMEPQFPKDFTGICVVPELRCKILTVMCFSGERAHSFQ